MSGLGAGNFTFPTDSVYQFIVADLVNVTWTVDAPVISLYETCGRKDYILEDQIPNNNSYVWTATRDNYVESGCKFSLQPFTAEGESYGNNVTSVTFGVSKRYTDDPDPVEYNFAIVTETETETSSTSTPTATATTTTSATTETTSPSETDTEDKKSSGLSTSAKIGIGLGVPLGVLLLVAIGLGIFFCRRRRQRRRARQSEIREIRQSDGLAPLPPFEGVNVNGYKNPARLSQAETLATQVSGDHRHHNRNYSHELRSEYSATGVTERPTSELMSSERAELG
ncbi:hypothetical protein BDW74DRAFT_69695 [Aspergillus multicolor]|uniref:uncharacterized protein n=1 Tax=Aspergillus multicolor TaxID=41759 RepID=UPI003CCD43CA